MNLRYIKNTEYWKIIMCIYQHFVITLSSRVFCTSICTAKNTVNVYSLYYKNILKFLSI
jgi:hypothetical protein